MRRRHADRSDNGALRWPTLVTLFVIVLVATALVTASPIGLRAFGGPDGEWQRLSFIGQTYGAVSALIATIALVGVIATLVLQFRENRRAVQESRRQAMSELLLKAMDDPDLDECWGPVPDPGDPKVRRQQLYINMIVSQWSVAYETGAMPEKRLRAIAREMFSAPPGRAYWGRVREKRLSVVTEGKLGRFNRILDEEFQRAPEPPAVESAEAAHSHGGRGARRLRWAGAGRWVVAGLVGFGLGAVVARRVPPPRSSANRRAHRARGWLWPRG
ncbi:DUF6082 family protein [Halostreptopolyspora alba]|uniref:DUF6082 family protein n=1 Tax=Halostreptopolyspora alba TaxID=2487137 RepID=UPI0011CDBEA2